MKLPLILILVLLAAVSGYDPFKELVAGNKVPISEFERIINSIKVGTAKPVRASRILGGATAFSSQFPYQAALFLIGEEIKLCAGTIIAKNYILTVAHCVQE